METKLCECGCGQPTGIARWTNRSAGWVKGQPKHFIKGHANKGRHINVRHGMSRTPEHRAFINAKERCSNPNSKSWNRYGARGIRFLFTSFEQFFSEVGRRPEGKSLDRKNNDGNYEPGNVHWATPVEQANNRRSSCLTMSE